MDDFFATSQAAYRQQLAMLDRLRRQKRRMRSVRVWRRVTVVVFATIFTAILTDKAYKEYKLESLTSGALT
ncbi:hypothetical protein ZWY2020_046081 [Hordeum vulgare]|nr:hypothetical protein ZWY2020_046081 [Hordeum vulgare]